MERILLCEGCGAGYLRWSSFWRGSRKSRELKSTELIFKRRRFLGVDLKLWAGRHHKCEKFWLGTHTILKKNLPKCRKQRERWNGAIDDCLQHFWGKFCLFLALVRQIFAVFSPSEKNLAPFHWFSVIFDQFCLYQSLFKEDFNFSVAADIFWSEFCPFPLSSEPNWG